MRIVTNISIGHDPTSVCTEFEDDESLLIYVALLNLEPIHHYFGLPRSLLYRWEIGTVAFKPLTEAEDQFAIRHVYEVDS